jgi:NitT/TauT family transport system permease protein
MLRHAGYTIEEAALGAIIGAVPAIVLPFALRRMPTVVAVLDPFMMGGYGAPKLALAPLFILWFGIGIESKIAMSGIIVFFLVFLNTYAGVREVNPLYLSALQVMGASPWQLLRYVVLPSAASWVLTGLKVSVPYALIGTVVGEFMSSNRGIGFLISQASGVFDTPGVFAGLIVLAVVGAAINGGLKRVERHVLRWR